MNLFWQLLYILLWVLQLLLTARIVLEFVRMFARSWMPSGRSAIAVESVYTVTDPPVKLLRRVIPMVRVGGVALDRGVGAGLSARGRVDGQETGRRTTAGKVGFRPHQNGC